jgi:Protein of unknown function (DUF3768)
VVVTPAVRALPLDKNAALLEAVRTFNTFDRENDPHGEHDFGSIGTDGETYFYGRRRRGRRRTARNESGRRFARKTTGGVLKAAHGDI